MPLFRRPSQRWIRREIRRLESRIDQLDAKVMVTHHGWLMQRYEAETVRTRLIELRMLLEHLQESSGNGGGATPTPAGISTRN
ncbi:hypothetical protein ACP70R_003294 [Stipagrostis hirtigluma subsp. patula]